MSAPAGALPAVTVSVVLPVFNGHEFLDTAVRSLLGQTRRDFEMIIVDDGSTDDTPARLRRWQQADPRIVVERRDHAGIVHALNHGLQRARGRYFARMDADDISLPARFERQVDYLDSHSTVVALGSWSWYVDPLGRRLKLSQAPIDGGQIEQGLLRGEGGALLHPTLMARTETVRAVGGYREEMRLAEDMDLYFRLLERGELANVPEPLLEYRLHYSSTNHTQADRQWALVEQMRREQYARRGLPPPRLRPRPAPMSRAQCHRQWAREAVAGARWPLALLHAMHAFRLAPGERANLKLWRQVVGKGMRACAAQVLGGNLRPSAPPPTAPQRNQGAATKSGRSNARQES